MTLSGQPGYQAAKKAGDAKAALKLVEFLLNEEAIHAVGDMIDPRRMQQTYIVVPARTFESPANVIPHVLAQVIANELGIQVCQSVYQYDGVKRDRSGFWERFANPVSFFGNIPRGADFIIADDVVTTGGTLASLRGFVEMQGGRVICMTGLSSSDGQDVKLSLDRGTLIRLKSGHNGALVSLIFSETGYAIEQLTEPEAGKLLGARSPHSIRQAIFKARHQTRVGEGAEGDGGSPT